MMKVDNQMLGESITEVFGSQVLGIEETFGTLDIVVEKSIILPLISYLKTHDTFKVNFLTSLCGVHFPEQKEKELAVVYHLHSFVNNIRFRIHVFLPIEKPEIPSLTTLFTAANWMERETFEFYGIKFIGHPDLRIILNVEDMDYHPLLKQYPLVDATRTDKDDKYFGR